MQECTFKPQTKTYRCPFNDRKSKQEDTDIIGRKLDKNAYLYSRAKTREPRKDRNRQDYEFEKDGAECSFKPNIQNSQKSIALLYKSTHNEVDSINPNAGPSSSTQNIRGFQKTMERLQKGREENEKKKMMLSRGVPGT